MLYIVGTAMMPNTVGTYKSNLISLQEAKELVKIEAFTSAVGHSATAELMSDVLNADIPLNRTRISLECGDKMLCFKMRPRLGEGVIIKSRDILEKIGYNFVLVSYSE